MSDSGSWLDWGSRLLALILGGATPSQTAPPLASATIIEVQRGDGPAWGTLSGLSAHPTDPSRLFAVTDEDSPPARVVEIVVEGEQARVVRQTVLTGEFGGELDCEAVAVKPEGGFWIASEGGPVDDPPNRLLEVDAAGRVQRVVTLPAQISARIVEKGLEGIAIVDRPQGRAVLVGLQGAIDGDADDTARIAMLDPARGIWTFWLYPLRRLESGKVSGLSELLYLGGERFAAIERDGKGGRRAVKRVTSFAIPLEAGAAAEAPPPRLVLERDVDLVPVFLDADRKVEKEIEGLTIAADGQVYLVTDNDNQRPTVLVRLGPAADVFAPDR